MNAIDKVTLYPFSPLKLLHETRKLTASQAKFFVALMCLYFERDGWLYYRDQDGRIVEEMAAQYAPYCGVTKKTFMKMIDALESVGVVVPNTSGGIEPVFAEEIHQATKEGTHRVNTVGGFEEVDPTALIAAKEGEGVAAVADATFQEEPEARGDNSADAGADGDDPLEGMPFSDDEKALVRKYCSDSRDMKFFCRISLEEQELALKCFYRRDTMSVATRLEAIKEAAQTTKIKAQEEAKKKFKHHPFQVDYVYDAVRDALWSIAKYDLDKEVKELVHSIMDKLSQETVDAFNQWAKTPAGKKYDEELAAALAAQ